MIWEISYRGHHFQGQVLYFLTLIDNLECELDGCQIKEVFFSSPSGSVILPGSFRQKPFSVCWTVKVSQSFELELKMWRLHDGRLPCCEVSCALLKSFQEVHFSTISFPNANLDGDPLGPPLALAFTIGHFLVVTPPSVGQTFCDGSTLKREAPTFVYGTLHKWRHLSPESWLLGTLL